MGSIKAYAIAALVALVLILLGALGTWGAWTYRGHLADKQVQQVKEDYDKLLMKERQFTDHYRELSDAGYAKVMEAIGKIKVTHTTVTNNIELEKKSNPDFYNQPLPAGGRQSWLDARSLMQ